MKAVLILENIDVDPETNCWLWRGRRNKDGYGLVYVDGKVRLVHRVLYELQVGPIPDRAVLDHMKDDRGPCRWRHCCNPAHLQPVTVRENSQFVVPWNSLKDSCPMGHDYAVHGRAYRGKDGYERRYCQLCDAERRRSRDRKRREDSRVALAF